MNRLNLACVAFIFLTSHLSAGDFPAGLQEFIKDHYRALEARNVAKVRSNLHSKGKSLERMFAKGSMGMNWLPSYKYNLKKLIYIGTDGDYHYVRYREWRQIDRESRKKSDIDGFEVDGVMVFGREDNRWKIFDGLMYYPTMPDP